MKAYYNEIDPYCCRVLRKQIALGNLPPGDVDERDIRQVDPEGLREYGHIHLFAGIGGFPLGFARAGVPADLKICSGGFPCQDISSAGPGAGIDGARSGLWAEYARVIRILRPQFVVVENVSALLGRGMGRVLGDLAALGYDTEWESLPASAFGAPHQRDRVWIVAYPNRQPGDEGRESNAAERPGRWDAHRSRVGQDVSDTGGNGREQGPEVSSRRESIFAVRDRNGGRNQVLRRDEDSRFWLTEPDVGRVAHGIPRRVDRLTALGNAVVPQVAQFIGERIVAACQHQ